MSNAIRIYVPVERGDPFYEHFTTAYAEARKNGETGVALAADCKTAFAEVIVSVEAMQRQVDRFMREIVEERLRTQGALPKIEAALDRRLDVAVKTAIDSYAPSNINAVVRKMVDERVAAIITSRYEVVVDVRLVSKAGGA